MLEAASTQAVHDCPVIPSLLNLLALFLFFLFRETQQVAASGGYMLLGSSDWTKSTKKLSCFFDCDTVANLFGSSSHPQLLLNIVRSNRVIMANTHLSVFLSSWWCG